MKEDYIPITAIQDDYITTWYIDISNMNLSQLISLKKALEGINEKTIRIIDGTIIKGYAPSVSCREKKHNCREYKKEQKEIKSRKLKKAGKKYRRRK